MKPIQTWMWENAIRYANLQSDYPVTDLALDAIHKFLPPTTDTARILRRESQWFECGMYIFTALGLQCGGDEDDRGEWDGEE